MTDTVQFDVAILGREFKVACQPDEKAELLAAVTYLDHKMREMRDKTKTNGLEKIAVMAGLNIAHELLKARAATNFDSEPIRRRITDMQVAIDQAMVEQDELF